MKRSEILVLWLSFICLGSVQLYSQEYTIYNQHYGGYWVMDQNGSGRILLSDNIPGAEGTFTVVDAGNGKWAIKAKGEKFLRLNNTGVMADAGITNRTIFSSVGNENARLFRSENLRFLFVASNKRLVHQAWSDKGAFVFRLTAVNAVAGPDYQNKETPLNKPPELKDVVHEPVVPAGTYAMKPPLSTNGWVSHGGVLLPTYYANRDGVDSWEKIQFIAADEKDVYFLRSDDGNYLSAQPSGAVFKAGQPQAWEKWGIVKKGNYFAIISIAHRRFLSANKSLGGLLGTSPTFGDWEKWTLQKL